MSCKSPATVIARLASMDPMRVDNRDEVSCFFCDAEDNRARINSQPIGEPIVGDHAPDCLWRLARGITRHV